MAISCAEKAYREALKSFEEHLDSKQLQEVQRPSSLDELCQLAKDINSKHGSEDRKTIRFSERVGKIREALRPFDGLLSGICELSPTGGKLIWSSVRFTFQLAEDAQSIFDAVFEFFEGIALELEIVQTEIDTFKDSQLVFNVAQQVFAVLVEFWVHAVKTYRNLRFGSLKSHSIRTKFEKLQDSLREQVLVLKHAAQAQHHQNSQNFWAELQHNHRDEKDQQVFDWLRAPDYSSDLKKANTKRHDGTCVWILSRPEYKKWSHLSPESRLLVVYGVPGGGKTVLSSFLVEEAIRNFKTSMNDSRGLTVYHFFKADDETKNTPSAALRSFLDQFYNWLLEIGVEGVRNDLQNATRKRHIDYDDLLALFMGLIRQTVCRLTIVLDALDECTGIKSFCRDLKSLVALPYLRVVATSRKTGDHVDAIQGPATVTIFMNEDDVKGDIASFVRYKVDKMHNMNAPGLQRLKSLVLDELSKKENHKGMFLWAYLMCKDIKSQGNVAKIKRLLGELPGDLVTVYKKILERLNEKPTADQAFIQRVFQWVVGSIRPLRWSELDQALQIDRFRSELYEDDDEYEDIFIYSRKDVVKVCGCLVQYSGLNDGDTIRLIHLSAREFLQGKTFQSTEFPDSLRKYLVNSTAANRVLASTCLGILQSPSVRDNEYFQTDVKSEGHRVDLISMCPLFEYAVLYWPEFVCTIKITSSSRGGTQQNDNQGEDYFELLTSLLEGSWSLAWLEEYVRLGGVEIALYTAERIQNLDIDNASSKSSSSHQQWAANILYGLRAFSETISRRPETVHACIEIASRRTLHSTGHKPQTLITLGTPEVDSKRNPLPKSEHGWIGYNHKSRSIFLVGKDYENIRVGRRNTDSGTVYRPATKGGEESPTGNWIVRSAQLKQDATFLAVTFCPRANHEILYRTVCWSMACSQEDSVTDDWAQVIIADRCESSIFSAPPHHVRGNLTSFGDDNTLITPGGIWDLATEEKISAPESIFCPEEAHLVSQTCFSSRRAARVRDRRYLEVLELFNSKRGKAGQLAGRFEFSVSDRHSDNWARVQIRCFSRSGNKLLLIYLEDEEHARNLNNASVNSESGANAGQNLCVKVICLALDEQCPTSGTEIDLPIHSGLDLRDCQFTGNEEKIVGLTSAPENDVNASGTTILVWSLRKDAKQYKDRADTIFLWKSFDRFVTFTITPPISAEPEGGVLITLSDGSMVRRPVTKAWSSIEDETLRGSRQALEARGKTLNHITLDGTALFKIFITSVLGPSPTLTIEAWSLTEALLLLFPVIKKDLRPSIDLNGICMSPNGQFLVAKSEIFGLLDPSSPQPLSFRLDPGGGSNISFCPNHSVFAYFREDQTRAVLRLFEMQPDHSCKLLATHTILAQEGFTPREVKVAVLSRSVFAYSYWTELGYNGTFVVSVANDEMTATEISEDYMADLTFSSNGEYIFSVDRQVRLENMTWPTPIPVPKALNSNRPSSLTIADTHPITLERDYCFIDSQRIYRLYQDGRLGFTYLDVKRLDAIDTDEFYRKSLGIIPDDYLDRRENKLCLVWPKAPLEAVKLVVVPDERNGILMMVQTGISSSDLVRDCEMAEQE